MAKGEWARYWQHEQLPGIDLLRARYVRHAFPRHSHEGYVFGAVSGGVEDVVLPGRTVHAMPGSVVMINPEVSHAARAGVPEGWAYSTLYPSVEVVADIAAETTAIRGTAGFAEVDVIDPQGAQLIREVHRAAEEGNALAADSVLRILVARLLSRYGGSLPGRTLRSAGCRKAVRARAVLEERMAAPPSLDELATELGTSPFALLRAFKLEYGMPPHTWLTNARVRRARALLDAGTAPAEAAAAVGFTDQPHLNRHFTRIVGVPPGAYQRERGEQRGIAAPVPGSVPLLAGPPAGDTPRTPPRDADTRAARKNVQDRSEPFPVSSGAWQNRQHPQLYAPAPETPRGANPATVPGTATGTGTAPGTGTEKTPVSRPEAEPEPGQKRGPRPGPGRRPETAPGRPTPRSSGTH